MTIKLSELAANPLTLLSAVAPPALGDLMLVNDISEVVTINKTKAMTLQTLATMLAPLIQGVKVNGLYFSTEATNPATSLGYGTWTAYAAGRVPIGVGTSDAVYAAGATGGASFHVNTLAELAVHVHLQYAHDHASVAHVHTSAAHDHTSASHNHTQDAHGHTGISHNHTQYAHGHTGISHNHTQNSHNHTQDAHSHSISGGEWDGNAVLSLVNTNHISNENTGPATATNQAATATNQAATAGVNNETATNQAATAGVNNTTATNQATTPGNVGSTTPGNVGSTTPGNVGSATATNQNAGSGVAWDNTMPWIAVFIWKRIA